MKESIRQKSYRRRSESRLGKKKRNYTSVTSKAVGYQNDEMKTGAERIEKEILCSLESAIVRKDTPSVMIFAF